MATRPTITQRVARAARAATSPTTSTGASSTADTAASATTSPAARLGAASAAGATSPTSTRAPGFGTSADSAASYDDVVRARNILRRDDLAPGFGTEAETARTPGGTRSDAVISIEDRLGFEREDEIDFEDAEELFLSLGELDTQLALRIRNIDASGFITHAPIAFGNADPGAILAFSVNNRKMSIARTRFSADLFDDNNLLRDAIMVDYATFFDGVDVSVSLTDGSLAYDESERAGIEMKFWRVNTTNAVYRNLLETDFSFANPIDTPIIQLENPEEITTDSFTSLPETAAASDQIDVSGIPEGFTRFASSGGFTAPAAFSPGGY